MVGGTGFADGGEAADGLFEFPDSGTGKGVTPEKLSMIERAENLLRDAGFVDVRVRHHELKTGNLARIEVGRTEMPKFFEPERMEEIGLKLCVGRGDSQVTLDMLGYRRGSLNEGLTLQIRPERNFQAAAGLNSLAWLEQAAARRF